MTDTEFVEQIDKYRNELFRYIYLNVWNASSAEDVFSNAVMAAYENLHKFRDGTNFRASYRM